MMSKGKQKPTQSALQIGTHFPQELSHCDLEKCPKFVEYKKRENENAITDRLFQIPE